MEVDSAYKQDWEIQYCTEFSNSKGAKDHFL